MVKNNLINILNILKEKMEIWINMWSYKKKGLFYLSLINFIFWLFIIR